jgi:hypothetical protein
VNAVGVARIRGSGDSCADVAGAQGALQRGVCDVVIWRGEVGGSVEIVGEVGVGGLGTRMGRGRGDGVGSGMLGMGGQKVEGHARWHDLEVDGSHKESELKGGPADRTRKDVAK